MLDLFFWITAEVDEIKREDLRVNKVYELKQIEKIYEAPPPKLRFIAFDIEVHNKYGFPDLDGTQLLLLGFGLMMDRNNL
ncbi:hypothetical protein [Metallosphaera hakonensis]|uniref:hypothetical protein n=1 Tax=Metallosphaera hakonensis TaxID=79601 RepID=UPI00278C01C4|nr:hypothetical protein [Metallosphaera hakonensis]